MPTPVCDDWLIDAFRPLTCNSAIFKNYAEMRVKWDSLNNWVWPPSATHRELEWDGKQKKQVKHILLLLVNSNVGHLFFKLLFYILLSCSLSRLGTCTLLTSVEVKLVLLCHLWHTHSYYICVLLIMVPTVDDVTLQYWHTIV